MAEKTEIAVSIMPKIEDKLVELSGKLEQIMQAKAPAAWETALAVVRIDAAGKIVVGIIAVSLAFFLIRQAIRWFVNYGEITREKGERYRNDEEFKYMIGGIISGGLGGIATKVGFFSLVAPWTWVALFRPELVIAKQILGKFL